MALGQKRLLLLVSLTFFVGTMITLSNFNQPSHISSQSNAISLSTAEKQALAQYFAKHMFVKKTGEQNQYLLARKPIKSADSSTSQSNSAIITAQAPDAESKSLGRLDDKLTAIHPKLRVLESFNLVENDAKPESKADFKSEAKFDTLEAKQSNGLAPYSNITNVQNTKVKSSKQVIKPLMTENRKANQFHVHTAEELALTTSFVDEKKGFCSTDHGFGLDLLVMVVSSPGNFKARAAIRETWGGFAVERGSKLLFVVGRSNEANPVQSNTNEATGNQTSSTDFVSIDDRIRAEDALFGDILQVNFVDAYYNLTLKTIALMRWAEANCGLTKYMLKIDDDMFVNMQLLVDFTETRTFKTVIIGKIAKHWLPHRELRSKWYVPKTAFNGTMFPNFATGPAYLVSGNALPLLLKTLNDLNFNVLKLEDVFMTGIVAEKAGVRRINYSMFRNVYFSVNQCNFGRFITSHQHSASEIRRLWKLVYTGSKAICVKKPETTALAKTAAASGFVKKNDNSVKDTVKKF